MKHFLLFLALLVPLAAEAPFVAIPRSPFYAALFSWEAGPGGSVAGYRVQWGTGRGVYEHGVDAGMATRVIIGDFVEGVRYYSSIVAYAEDGRESEPSPEIEFWLVPAESATVTLEKSSDLETWETVSGFYFPRRSAGFYRFSYEF